ncbi:MAG: hypothetical protein GY863_02200 [bacterium]|nr:hypothetical protein [bacterium]
MMRNSLKLVLIMVISMLIIADTSAQEIKTIDGVKTIINEGRGEWGRNPEVKIELVKTIGDLFGESEEVMFYLPSDIAKDSEGNLYILDTGNFYVKKFSPEGEYMLSFGGQGQGPGELSHPTSININNEGNIVVSDQGNNRFEVFTPDGKNLKSYKLDDLRVGFFRFKRNGDLVMSASGVGGGMILIGGDEEEEDKPDPLFRVLDTAGELKKEIGKQIDVGDKISNVMVNNLYYCLDEQDNLYLTYRGLNRIAKYSPDGNIQFRIERELDYDVKEPEKAKVERSGGNVSISMPEITFVSNAISVDSKGRIWVCTANRQLKDDEKISKSISITSETSTPSIKVDGNTEITKTDMYDLEIYSPEGTLLGKIRLDHFVDAIKIYGDKLYILDENRGMQYYEYRIIG